MCPNGRSSLHGYVRSGTVAWVPKRKPLQNREPDQEVPELAEQRLYKPIAVARICDIIRERAQQFVRRWEEEELLNRPRSQRRGLETIRVGGDAAMDDEELARFLDEVEKILPVLAEGVGLNADQRRFLAEQQQDSVCTRGMLLDFLKRSGREDRLPALDEYDREMDQRAAAAGHRLTLPSLGDQKLYRPVAVARVCGITKTSVLQHVGKWDEEKSLRRPRSQRKGLEMIRVGGDPDERVQDRVCTHAMLVDFLARSGRLERLPELRRYNEEMALRAVARRRILQARLEEKGRTRFQRPPGAQRRTGSAWNAAKGLAHLPEWATTALQQPGEEVQAEVRGNATRASNRAWELRKRYGPRGFAFRAERGVVWVKYVGDDPAEQASARFEEVLRDLTEKKPSPKAARVVA